MSSARLGAHRAASRIHRWLALIVGAQVLLWFGSGLLMSLMPIEQVRGDHLIDRDRAEPLVSSSQYAPLPALIHAAGGGDIRRIELRMLLGRAIAEAETSAGEIRLIDARTAARLPPLGAIDAIRTARAAYRGDARGTPAAEHVARAGGEFRGRVPAWRVSFPDAEGTRIYVSAGTGRIGAIRTDRWRLYDFAWGLHIMDWSERERFNTPWMRGFAGGALLLALAGAALLAFRRRRRRSRQPDQVKRVGR